MARDARKRAKDLRAKADAARRAHDQATAAHERAQRALDHPPKESWVEDAESGLRWTTDAAKLKSAAEADLTHRFATHRITREAFDADMRRLNTEEAHQEFERQATAQRDEAVQHARAELERARQEEERAANELHDSDAAAADAERAADAAQARADRICRDSEVVPGTIDDGLPPPPVPPKAPAPSPEPVKESKCSCVFTVTIAGPANVGLGCGPSPTRFPMPTEDQLSGVLHLGEGQPLRYYRAEPHVECTGGGSVDIETSTWTAEPAGESHLTITVVVTGTQRCPGEPSVPVSAGQIMNVRLSVTSCCGPDITNGFIASVNRIYAKLHPRVADTVVGFSPTSFFLDWGHRMIYRPYEPGGVFASGCPSPGCNDTVTILGSCYDCFVADNLLFGMIAGFVDMPVLELEAGGWAAKLAKNLDWTAHLPSEALWRKGHALGQHAKRAYDARRPFAFDRAALAGALRGTPQHLDCHPCSSPSPNQAFTDFANEGW